MLPGKKSELKFNPLLEESATEKLSRSKLFMWVLSNTRLVGTAAAIAVALFLALAFFMTRSDAEQQEEYIKLQASLDKMKSNLYQGNDEEAVKVWQETKTLLSHRPSFRQAFQAESAQLLLMLGKDQDALPLMTASIERTATSFPESARPFDDVTLQIAAGDISKALQTARQFDEASSENVSSRLRAFNLLQIPAIARVANEKDIELQAIEKIFRLIEAKDPMSQPLLTIATLIQSERVNYLDYLKERKLSLNTSK
ncbi:hypothetical protein [Estrella lausannensis]|uniref:Putative membrane protein n=1 Tax=Estrella lausannensis TaxID=483423 RepID=A0A0H5DSX4_9BACT|nr:hypothetical protein [Estrella lausannensis]CRX38919.1 putative membrane protein [Estrella lausannensis]